MNTWRILHGDVRDRLRDLPDGSVQTCVTSPPYWGLRDYGTAKWDGGDPDCDHRQQLGGEGVTSAKQNTSAGTQTHQYRTICGKCGATRIDNQIGLEQTPEAFVAALVSVFAEVRRVLADDGTVWINLGDTINGKQLQGVPWRVAFALQADGWFLRSDIIWSKPNPMPESVTDRPTKAHEYIFLLSKAARYYYDADAIADSLIKPLKSQDWETRRAAGASNGSLVSGANANHGAGVSHDLGGWNNTRNKRSVWHIATQPYPESHSATMPEDLVKPCILAGSRVGDTVLDPFSGSGTTGVVALNNQRNYIGIELNGAYIEMARKRIGAVAPLFASEVA